MRKIVLAICFALALTGCANSNDEMSEAKKNYVDNGEVDECTFFTLNGDGTFTVLYTPGDDGDYRLSYKKMDGDAAASAATTEYLDEKATYALIEEGDYMITVKRNLIPVKRCTITYEVEEGHENDVYLSSTSEINWDYDDEPIKLAQKLVDGKTTDYDKFRAIWEYIRDNYYYDFDKADNLGADLGIQTTDINETYKTNYGICYDFAALQAAMLRSVGIPTKMCGGYLYISADFPEPTSLDYGVYGHAWNQVYIDGEWHLVDVTNDLSAYGTLVTEPYRTYLEAYQQTEER